MTDTPHRSRPMTLTPPPDDGRMCVADCGKPAPECQCRARYPYTHHGPAVYGSKLADYLISEASLREDEPELFKEPTTQGPSPAEE